MSDRNQRLFRALLDIGKELAGITDLDRLLPRILEITRDIFKYDNAIIRLLSSDGETLESAASYGYSEAAVNHPIRLGQGVMGKAARFGKPYLIHNLVPEDDYIPGIDLARSEMAIPLIARDKVIGVFNVESQQADAFSAKDCDRLSILAGQAAIAIDNAHLYRDLCQVSREKDNLHHLNQQILASISIGLYTVDQNLDITSWNLSMERMSNIPAQKALGQPLLKLFPTLEKEGVATRLREVLEHGKAQNLRLLHRGQAGDKRLQKRCLAPLKEQGQTVGAVVVVEDITEFEQLLAQTIQSEKLAEVGRMSAGIAHEINNPLAVISYACQILQEQDSASELETELLQRINLEVERLQQLTSELLSYSGRQEDRRTATDLNQILGEVLTLLTYELNKKQIQLTTELGDIPLRSVDGNKFKQIFINLILNAVQAMEPRGQIHIISGVDSNQTLTLRFCDSGPGIPDHLKEQVFEPFFTNRLDGTGTGLGLYLCRKIIADHKGTLRVSDNLPHGCCFELQLPAEPS